MCSSDLDFYNIHGRIPKARELENKEYYGICRRSITKRFGSWNSLIEAAGFQPNVQSGLGISTVAKDNKLYRSSHEAYFVDHFLFEKEEYEYEKPYGNGWYYDFYLPKYNLYIELDGGLRPQRIQEKINFCKQNNLRLKVINSDEIYNSNLTIK